MGLYNFQQRFVPLVESGAKTHTIREIRKYPSKPGEQLYLYEGLRTKRARRILVATCTAVEDLQVYRRAADDALAHARRIAHRKTLPSTITPSKRSNSIVEFSIAINGCALSDDEIEAFARLDGFADFDELISFWRAQKRRFPWRGHLIHWRFPDSI